MEIDYSAELLMALLLILQLTGLAFAVKADPYISKQNKGILQIIEVLIFSLLVRDAAEYMIPVPADYRWLKTILSIYGYSIRPVILVLFGYIVSKKKSAALSWTLVVINFLIHLTALFSGICFSFTETGHFSRGILGYSCHVTSGLLLMNLLSFTIRSYRKDGNNNFGIPIINVAVIVGSVILDSTELGQGNHPFSFLSVSVVSCSLFYYIWLHLQFTRRYEKELIEVQKIRISMSQIQPHFLYNILSTIQALVRVDPEKASDTIEKLGLYLRRNVNSVNVPGRIPIMEEIQHTKVYSDIELVRFPSLRIEYDIEDQDFKVPALTVQPLVENAFRHGVRGVKNGLITVKTFRNQNMHEIVIRDNGKGFNTEELKTWGSEHVGIRNVHERIEQMCGGTIKIESTPDEGTTVTIRIPDDHENQTESVRA
ncbi:MAG: histidine kinase [Solobacterium sp.]|nr:histidine kinase [Solobacterium sp.]